jgi:plastocyanin
MPPLVLPSVGRERPARPAFDRLAAVLAAVAVSLSRPALADSAVEGVVQLPPPAPAAVVPARYQNQIVGVVAQPDPPMAVVYLKGQFSPSPSTSAPAARMEQKCYQFAPALLAIQTGTAVEFPNMDDGYHNVFSYSKPKRFDLGRYRKDEKPPTLVFDKAGVVKLYCEIHQHMRGTILVLDTPYFIKTGVKGDYRLEHLPAGKFTVVAWVDEKTEWERPVELRDGEVLHVDFTGK